MAKKITGQMDIGVYGMAVMGSNLALNMADHGFKVAAYNRTGRSDRKGRERSSSREHDPFLRIGGLHPCAQEAASRCSDGTGGKTGGHGD